MMQPFLIPELSCKPEIIGSGAMPDGEGRTLLVVIAHADDAAIFAGGTLVLFARAGWRVVILRITDDRWDSVALDEAETIRRNAGELQAAAAILGAGVVEDLDWRTDVLGDASRVALRERIIHAIRRHRPYGLMSFDPYAVLYEDNLDHKVLAEAVDEAFWTSMFDKHHPEHFGEGLSPHGCVERWYFGRVVATVTHVVNTSEVLELQLAAISAHVTPLANMAAQYALQCRTAGREVQAEAALRDPAGFFCRRFAAAAGRRGLPFGFAAAEYLRRNAVRFDDG
jgi:LmbE family N-acetylglucosaminyl deacetylase